LPIDAALLSFSFAWHFGHSTEIGSLIARFSYIAASTESNTFAE
jgi:hypothetical protein